MKKSWKKVCLLGSTLVLILPALIVGRFNLLPEDSVPLASVQRTLGIHYPSTPTQNAPPKIIGHRGSGGAPLVDNTRGAIQRGIEAGAHWIEIDVRKAAGGQLILFHDETVASLTGEPAEKAAKTATLDLDALRELQGSVNADDQIIALDETLKDPRFQEVRWVIDIKETGIRTALRESLSELPKENLILQGLFDIIREYADDDYDLAYAAGWSEASNKRQFLFGHGFIIDRCEELGPHLRYLSLPNSFVTQSLIDDTKARFPGIQVWSWRGETEEIWERKVGLGIDGLIVDDVEGAVDFFYPVSE